MHQKFLFTLSQDIVYDHKAQSEEILSEWKNKTTKWKKKYFTKVNLHSEWNMTTNWKKYHNKLKKVSQQSKNDHKVKSEKVSQQSQYEWPQRENYFHKMKKVSPQSETHWVSPQG